MKTDKAELLDDVAQSLRQTIITTLQEQGFSRNGDGSFALTTDQREVFRRVQDVARREKLQQHVKFLLRELPEARLYGRDGSLIDPTAIELELRLVFPGTLEERLFRWWNIVWWSIPYQRSYGRRLRFLLWDKAHDAPFGLIGLHSPPLKMVVRDEALGIKKEERDFWVNMALSAQQSTRGS